MRTPVIPPDLPVELQRYLRDYATNMERELSRYIPKDVGVASVLLVSPNGSVYSVVVADDGTLSATAVFTA